MKTILLLILLSAGISMIHAQGNWQLAKNKSGIRVFTGAIPGSEYHAFKAEMSVPETQAEIVKILQDVEKYPEWFAFTASAKRISQSSEEQVMILETDYPWPYANECMQYNMQFVKTQSGGLKITISGSNKNTNCKYAMKKAIGYILLEQVDGNSSITYYFHSEPSQNIPAWLINPRIHELPYQTFIALRKRLEAYGH